LSDFKKKEENLVRTVKLPLPSTPKTEKVLRSDGRYYREAPYCSVQIVEYVGVQGVFLRCIDMEGKLMKETYFADKKFGLVEAELRFGISKNDWKE
jgi:hypothetical protein